MKIYPSPPSRLESTRRLVFERELDLAGVLEARIITSEALSPGAVLELDLGGVSFMDSAGARFLVWAGDRARAGGGHVVLTALSHPVVRLLVLARARASVLSACSQEWPADEVGPCPCPAGLAVAR